MAAQATLALDRRMFKNERTARFCMALAADSILIGCGPDVVIAEGSMDIVAVAALNQPLIHLVVEGLCERRLHIGVALIAQQRLLRLQQFEFTHSAVHTVAAGAAYPGLGVWRARKVRVRSGMAGEAGRIYYL